MGNRNKRGQKKASIKQCMKMSATPQPNDAKSAELSTLRQTRSSGSNSDVNKQKSMDSNKGTSNKALNDRQMFAQDLTALKKEFKEELSKLKDEMKSNQIKSENELLETLDDLRARNQELKEKYKEKKRLVVSLKSEIDAHHAECKALAEEVTKWTGKYEDSVKLIELGNQNKLQEIAPMKQKVVELTQTVQDLQNELSKKDKEQISSLENLKKSHELEVTKVREKYESESEKVVSKDEYNSLVDEYEQLKNAFQENERKLNKVIDDKKAVEKSKLKVIREKQHVKDELMDFVINVNRELKPHRYQMAGRSRSPLDFRANESKLRHPPSSSQNAFTNTKFKRF